MYQALYRKYRPQTFSDVYGQEHVTQTLLNQLKSGRIFHAYLFTGSRGTGKTTCAKLLAKAACCGHFQEGEPCNQCEICRGIDDGTLMDVLEIDAASNNSVDDIRELREKAIYAPSTAKYRVYIIDEVHMLSPGAFNALLKTLEEPPAHVIFILATTEVHKLPATILSRCQRFDFHRITPELLAKRVKHVCKLEGLSVTDSAADLIASLADGGMRDALSILDLCAGCDGQITEEVVAKICGMASRDYLFQLVDNLQKNQVAAALELISQLHATSVDMLRLCEELISHLRDLMLIKTLKSTTGLVVCSSQELEFLHIQAENWRLDTIIYALELLESTLNKMGRGNRRTLLEMAIVKLCNPTLSSEKSAILSRLGALESAVKTGGFSSQSVQPSPISAAATGTVPAAPIPAEPAPAPANPLPPEPPAPSAAGTTSPISPADSDTPPWPEDAPPLPDAPPWESPALPEAVAPCPAPVPPPAPPAPPAQKAVPNAVAGQEFTPWGEVLEILSQKDKLFWSITCDVEASLDSGVLHLKTDSTQFRELYQAETPTYRELLQRAVLEATGQSLKIVLDRDTAGPGDPLDAFLEKASSLQLTID